MRDDNKNLIIAIVLSVVVLIGWNYFYGMPMAERQKAAAPATATQQAGSTVPGAAPREGQPAVPPAEHLTGSAIAGAVVLASVRTSPERSRDRLLRFIGAARDIAAGGAGRMAAEPSA